MRWRAATRASLRSYDRGRRGTAPALPSAKDYADAAGWEAVPRFNPVGVSRADIESWAREYADEHDYDIHDVYDWLYGYADEPGG